MFFVGFLAGALFAIVVVAAMLAIIEMGSGR